MSTVLNVRGLAKNFGGIRALNDVDLKIDASQIVALIGPNGAGKTTFFNCVTGIYTPTEGEISTITPDGRELRLNGLKPSQVTEVGLARTFQNIRLFGAMTVLENVMVARYCRTRSGILNALLRDKKSREEEQASIDRAYELLRYVNLHTLYREDARNLPYGAQRRLEIARALATDPYILLLDEPAAGMNPQETQELKDLVLNIRAEFGLSILLIEHDMNMVMSISDYIYVMEYGSGIASGVPQEIRQNPQVIKAYLGEDDHA